jgi:ubiquinone/menaquinone biosynthesis C-methylase UbiE
VGFYENYILPRCIDWACGVKPIRRQREKVVPLAAGRVLEIGMGSGLNLPHYRRENVTKLWGLEPAAPMRKMAGKKARQLDIDVEFLDLPGEEIPLDDDSVDTVLMTYTLCTIPDPVRALAGMARVLRPGGKLIFCEHGAAPDAKVRRWQDRVNPLWKRIAGGCHLNRDIPALVQSGGFRVEAIETMYLPGWRPATFNYWGTAVAV